MKKITGSGIIPPLVTPINEDESINYDQLGKVIDHVVEGGVDAIFIMGTTGEYPRFSFEARRKATEEAVKMAAGRIPVYAGVGDAGLSMVKRHIEYAEKAGADVIVAGLPYYFPVNNDDDAYAYFHAVCTSTSLPVMLYNIPSTTAASISLDVIERLFPLKNVIGIKDSSGDAERLDATIKRFKGRDKDFAVSIGSEELSFEGLQKGADGVVPSMANPFPKLWADIYRSALAKDIDRLKTLCALNDKWGEDNQYSSAWTAQMVWRKKAMFHMGICNDFCTAPYLPVDGKADKVVRETVGQYRKMYS